MEQTNIIETEKIIKSKTILFYIQYKTVLPQNYETDIKNRTAKFNKMMIITIMTVKVS